jgi:hypothetical protein
VTKVVVNIADVLLGDGANRDPIVARLGCRPTKR